jgi:hypothetical protein
LGIPVENLQEWVASGKIHLRADGETWLVCAGSFQTLEESS